MGDWNGFATLGVMIMGVALGLFAAYGLYEMVYVPKMIATQSALDDKKNENDQLRAVLNEQNTKTQQLKAELEAANQPEVPVDIAFRKAILSPGEVLLLTNRSPSILQLRATYGSHFRSEQKTDNLIIDPQGTKQIGAAEGWSWVSGDTLKLEAPGYKTREALAP